MKNKILLLLSILALASANLSAKVIVNMVECKVIIDNENSSIAYSLNGCPVRIVTDPSEKADFKVCVVSQNAPEDYFFVYVTDKAYDCGEWKFVKQNERFSVRFVTNPKQADFCIRYTRNKYGAGGYPMRSDYGLNFIVK